MSVVAEFAYHSFYVFPDFAFLYLVLKWPSASLAFFRRGDQFYR